MQRDKLYSSKKRKYSIEESEIDKGYDSSSCLSDENFPLPVKRIKPRKSKHSKLKNTSSTVNAVLNQPSKKTFKSTNYSDYFQTSTSQRNSDSESQIQHFLHSPLSSCFSTYKVEEDSYKETKQNENGEKISAGNNQSALVKRSDTKNGYITDRSDIKTVNEVDFMMNALRNKGSPRTAKSRFNNKQKSGREFSGKEYKNKFSVYLREEKKNTHSFDQNISLEQKITIGASIVSACLGFAMKYSEVFSNAK